MRDAKRLAFIDSLRGLAALYVVIFHIAMVPKFKPVIPQLIKPYILNGWTGVTLFFVISAFTLCYTLKQKDQEKRPVLFFYIRRGFRILPLYYAWFLFMCIDGFGWDLIKGIWLAKKSMVLYIFFGYNFFPGKQGGMVLASWTLGVEMVFYLFFPLIFKYCKNLKRSSLFFLVSLLISWLHNELTRNIPNYVQGMSILTQLPVFAIGIICYYIFLIVERRVVSIKIFIFLNICSLILLFGIPYFPNLFNKVPLEYPMSIAYGMLLIGLSILPFKIIVNRVSVFIGLISYSMYLNHPRIVYIFGGLYERVYSYGFMNIISFFICVLITILPLILISLFTYNLIEKPGIKMGRNIINRMKAKVSQPRYVMKNQ